MTESNRNDTTTANKPSHVAYQVRNYAEGKAFWNRIGSAWANKDGNGFTIQLDCVPLDGRISLRIATEKKD